MKLDRRIDQLFSRSNPHLVNLTDDVVNRIFATVAVCIQFERYDDEVNQNPTYITGRHCAMQIRDRNIETMVVYLDHGHNMPRLIFRRSNLLRWLAPRETKRDSFETDGPPYPQYLLNWAISMVDGLK